MTSRRDFLGSALAALAALRLDRRLAPPRRRVGVNVHQVDARTVRLLDELGITQVRLTIDWNVWSDPRREAFRTDRLDAIDRLRRAGIDLLVVVHSPIDPAIGPTRGAVAMGQLMTTLVTLRRGLTWQIMNEMDGTDGFSGGWFRAADRTVTQRERGALYGRFLAPVYDAIKKADPTAKVVTGGIAFEPAEFYDGLRSRAPGKYDAVCVHCYGSPVEHVMRAKSRTMRPLLGDVPLWCTEWGSRSTSETLQAKEIGDALLDNDANSRYDRTYLYVLADGAPNYAVAYSDGGLRAAAQLLRNRTAR